MKEIKMSDVFELPLRVKANRGITDEYECDIVDSKCCVVYPSVVDWVDCGAIAHAINNHDRLVEQNKELVAQLSRFSEVIFEDLHMWSDEIDAEMKKTNELLTKIKGE